MACEWKKVYNKITVYDNRRALKGDIKYASTKPEEPCFIIHDQSFGKVLGSSPKMMLVEQRSHKFAHEAGVYLKSAGKNYFTSNYESRQSVQIYGIDCKTNVITEEKFDLVNANGACNYEGKILFCCQGDYNTPSALVSVDPLAKSQEIVLNNLYGREFNSINDAVIHHGRGEIWFTDPGHIACVADGFVQCNGLCFSHDYQKMYITDTGAVQAHGKAAKGQPLSTNPRLPASIYCYDVVDSGTRLANKRMFAYCSSGVPDGIKCDASGNVYSGCGDGVHVWDPSGTLLGRIYVGSMVANLNFGPDGLWVMAEERLFLCEIDAKGALVDVECM